jgi:hypothetical protein
MKEQDIKFQIEQFLTLKKLFWWRVNVGMATYDGKRKVVFGTKGQSDIAILAKNYIVLEVKTRKEHEYIKKHYDSLKEHYCSKSCRKCHYREQIFWIENVRSKGHHGFFVSSLDQTIEELKNIGAIDEFI